MSFISETSIETGLKPPSLVFPSLFNYNNKENRFLQLTNKKEDLSSRSSDVILQSNIYYASQLIKLRSELRSPYSNRPTSTTTTIQPRNSLLQQHFDNNDQFSYDGREDESELAAKPQQNNSFYFTKSYHNNHLSLPYLHAVTPEVDDLSSLNSTSDTEEQDEAEDDDDCHSFNRRILQRRRQQKKPQAVLVSLSPSSAAAASMAQSKRKQLVNKKTKNKE